MWGLRLLRAELANAGYTTDGVAGTLGLAPPSLLEEQSPRPEWLRALRADGNGSRLAVMVRLFYLGDRIPVATIQAFDPPLLGGGVSPETGRWKTAYSVSALNTLKLFLTDDDGVRGRHARFPLKLHPLPGGLVIMTDRYDARSRQYDPVMYLGIDSMALTRYMMLPAAAPPRRVSGATALLDVCTGSGVQGINAALRCAVGRGANGLEDEKGENLREHRRRAWGHGCHLQLVDVNPRAIRFARFNLALNAALLAPHLHDMPRITGPTDVDTADLFAAWQAATVVLAPLQNLSLQFLADHRTACQQSPQCLLESQRACGRGSKCKCQNESQAWSSSSMWAWTEGYHVMTANPPYVPDAADHGALFSGGGPLGDDVLLDIIRVAPQLMSTTDREGAALHIVGNIANIRSVANRVRAAWRRGGGGGGWVDPQRQMDTLSLRLFHGVVITPMEYCGRLGNHDPSKIVACDISLRQSGVKDVSPHSFLALRWRGGGDIAGGRDDRKDDWEGGDGGGGSRYGGNNTHGGEDGEVGKGVEGGAGKGSGDKNNGIRRRVHDGKADKARISATTLQYSCAVDSVPHACHDVSYSDADGATQRPYWDVAVGFRLWDALVGSQGADERVAAEGAIERQLRSMLAEIRG
jgi:methylase of polypeptide subunit release factors